MLTNPFTTLAQKAIVYGALAAVVVASALAAAMWWRASALADDLDACAVARSTLQGKLNLQNQEIDAWKAEAVAAIAQADALRRAAAEKTKASQVRAAELKTAIAAPPAGKTCGDALAEIRRGLKP